MPGTLSFDLLAYQLLSFAQTKRNRLESIFEVNDSGKKTKLCHMYKYDARKKRKFLISRNKNAIASRFQGNITNPSSSQYATPDPSENIRYLSFSYWFRS